MERTGKELLIASKAYAEENRLVSWWHCSTTFILCLIFVVAASAPLPMYVCFPCSIIAGLMMVRLFILYHDYLHGAILRDSLIAKALMYFYGMLVMSPPGMWKHTHDSHHKNNCKEFGHEVGAFPLMTTEAYSNASFGQRLGYRFIRSPFVILFGYFTSFFWNKSLRKFIESPTKNYSAGLTILFHFSLLVLVGMFSIQALILGLIIPLLLASSFGTYLFYAQHNFPTMQRREGEKWDYVHAALQSSSYMKMNPVMQWFTGNIGFHHVHHLNSKIPFYRLPEAMRGIKELQNPQVTSLSPNDIFSCLRLKLWDPKAERLLSFREARLLSS